MSTLIEPLITAAEYARMPDRGVPTELVRGRVIELGLPTPRHGQICLKVGRIVGNFADDNDLGHVVSNDSGVLTEKGPDTMRGADIAFYSYGRVPRGQLPSGYLDVKPELIFEVLSSNDRWPKVLAKVSEYLDIGVAVVCVLDPRSEAVQVYRGEELPHTLEGDDELTLPDVLPGFATPVKRFFA